MMRYSRENNKDMKASLQGKRETRLDETDYRQDSLSFIRRIKLTTTAANSATARIVGPNRSSNPLCPRRRILCARQWNVTTE